MDWQEAVALANEFLDETQHGERDQLRVPDGPAGLEENEAIFALPLEPFVPGAPRLLFVFKETREVRYRENRGSSHTPDEEPIPGGERALRPVAP